ncbi:MAG: ATP-dependent DNA ligase, partial [Sphingopyxis sp.]|nr:ATP-dependent DNA ligase [Sphingopyxis sp.]
MKRFAALIDRLIYTRSRNTKLALIVDYLRHTPDPDRGWAIAALTESLDFPAVKAGTVRALLASRVDEELFRLSRHFVGDTAETAALLWPEPDRGLESTRFPERSRGALPSEVEAATPEVLASLERAPRL